MMDNKDLLFRQIEDILKNKQEEHFFLNDRNSIEKFKGHYTIKELISKIEEKTNYAYSFSNLEQLRAFFRTFNNPVSLLKKLDNVIDFWTKLNSTPVEWNKKFVSAKDDKVSELFNIAVNKKNIKYLTKIIEDNTKEEELN